MKRECGRWRPRTEHSTDQGENEVHRASGEPGSLKPRPELENACCGDSGQRGVSEERRNMNPVVHLIQRVGSERRLRMEVEPLARHFVETDRSAALLTSVPSPSPVRIRASDSDASVRVRTRFVASADSLPTTGSRMPGSWWSPSR